MKKQAILFGSIGTLAETSELQRRAFNQAFEEAGIGWEWAPAEYANLLKKSGGQKRIENYALDRDQDVDAVALHNRKTEIYNQHLRQNGLDLRPGVAGVLTAAQGSGVPLAFVTTTSRRNVEAILDALGEKIPADIFAFVGDGSLVAQGKPEPDIYRLCCEHLKLDAKDCIAIEDTPISMKAARAAGVDCVGFPGEFAERASFQDAKSVVDRLDFDALINA